MQLYIPKKERFLEPKDTHPFIKVSIYPWKDSNNVSLVMPPAGKWCCYQLRCCCCFSLQNYAHDRAIAEDMKPQANILKLSVHHLSMAWHGSFIPPPSCECQNVWLSSFLMYIGSTTESRILSIFRTLFNYDIMTGCRCG